MEVPQTPLQHLYESGTYCSLTGLFIVKTTFQVVMTVWLGYETSVAFSSARHAGHSGTFYLQSLLDCGVAMIHKPPKTHNFSILRQRFLKTHCAHSEKMLLGMFLK